MLRPATTLARPRRTAIALVLLAALAASACDAGSGVAGCAPAVTEALDPLSSLHVLPGADVSFDSTAPTSGPHPSAPALSGLVDSPIDPMIQVSTIEQGHVIVQYRPDLGDPPDWVTDIAADDTVVAPGESLNAPIVLTAWTVRQECEAFDAAAIRAFVRNHAGRDLHAA